MRSSSSHHEHHIEIIFIYETSRPKCSTVHTKAYTNCTLHWSSWLCLVAKKWRNRGKQMKRYIQECNVPPTWILLPSIRLLCSDLADWLAGWLVVVSYYSPQLMNFVSQLWWWMVCPLFAHDDDNCGPEEEPPRRRIRLCRNRRR